MRYFVLFACGLMVAVALMPSTSWVFKNLADQARYSHAKPDFTDSDGDPESDSGTDITPPKNLTDPSLITVDCAKAELARGMLETDTGRAIERLLRYSRSHPTDPVGWACLLRVTCVAGTFSKFDNVRGVPKGYAQTHYYPAIEAVQNGMRVDPNNAFFPLMGACVHAEAGDLGLALLLIHRASLCTAYNDWIESASETTQRVFEAQWGFRGNLQRVRIESAVLLPHLAHTKKLARMVAALPDDRTGLNEREELFRVENLILRQGSTAIDLLVAIADNEILIGATKAAGSSTALTDEQRLERDRTDSAAIEAAIRSAGVDVSGASPVKIIANRTALTKAVGDSIAGVPDPTADARTSTRLGIFFLPIALAFSASVGIFCLFLWRTKGRVHWACSLLFAVSLLAMSGLVLAAVSYDGKLARWTGGMMKEGELVRSMVNIQS